MRYRKIVTSFGAFLLVLGIIILMIHAEAKARIYTFVDEVGTIHFSNVPTDARYRPATSSRLQEGMQPAVLTYSSDDDHTLREIRYDSFIRMAANQFEVDPLLVKAIIKAESHFNPNAVSKVGAQGLMQLMPETAKDLNVEDPFDPQQNIFGGTKYLRKLLGLFKGDIQLAVAAYNAGPNRVIQHGKIPTLTETSRYVKKVISHYDEYKAVSSPRKRWVKFSY